MRIAKILILEQESKIELQRNWLLSKGLDLSCLEPLISKFTSQKSDIDSMVAREDDLNKQLYDKYRELKQHTKARALRDLMKIKLENVKTNDNVVKFEDFCLTY